MHVLIRSTCAEVILIIFCHRYTIRYQTNIIIFFPTGGDTHR